MPVGPIYSVEDMMTDPITTPAACLRPWRSMASH
ncbi:MAG: hypothetical protein CM15mP92_2690 [Halieaceae bacterium]|nr:MAG: hypothetical protein CM15mP92_2690 [Halieaceae bacterium]